MDEHRFAVLRAVTGFLNADGGTLYIGVEEVKSGPTTIRGIEEDLRLVDGNIDKLRLSLTDQIADRIGDQFSPFITDRIEQVDGKCCWIVAVDPSPQPAFVRWKERKFFFVREGPSTRELDNERTWRYIKNRWG